MYWSRWHNVKQARDESNLDHGVTSVVVSCQRNSLRFFSIEPVWILRGTVQMTIQIVSAFGAKTNLLTEVQVHVSQVLDVC